MFIEGPAQAVEASDEACSTAGAGPPLPELCCVLTTIAEARVDRAHL